MLKKAGAIPAFSSVLTRGKADPPLLRNRNCILISSSALWVTVLWDARCVVVVKG